MLIIGDLQNSYVCQNLRKSCKEKCMFRAGLSRSPPRRTAIRSDTMCQVQSDFMWCFPTWLFFIVLLRARDRPRRKKSTEDATGADIIATSWTCRGRRNNPRTVDIHAWMRCNDKMRSSMYRNVRCKAGIPRQGGGMENVTPR